MRIYGVAPGMFVAYRCKRRTDPSQAETVWYDVYAEGFTPPFPATLLGFVVKEDGRWGAWRVEYAVEAYRVGSVEKKPKSRQAAVSLLIQAHLTKVGKQ